MMTTKEVMEFINKLYELNPQPFTPSDPCIIEDFYIYIPSLELKKDPIEDKWTLL